MLPIIVYHLFTLCCLRLLVHCDGVVARPRPSLPSIWSPRWVSIVNIITIITNTTYIPSLVFMMSQVNIIIIELPIPPIPQDTFNPNFLCSF